MDHKVQASDNDEPLLPSSSTTGAPPTSASPAAAPKPPKTRTQKAIRKTFKGTTRLSSLLPTGSVLIFETLSPILTDNGECKTLTNQTLSAALLLLCAASCFIMCFTDSVHDQRGKVHYGIATFKGLWVVDGLIRLEPNEAAKFKIRFIDMVHGVMSVLVFMAVASLNKDVIKCAFPRLPKDIKRVAADFPVWTGVVCGTLFVWFPSKRHGVANPVSRR